MSRLLAWSFGATVGLAVGFLVGESFRDGLALARLGRPEPREGAGTGPSATQPVSGAQIGVQRCGDVDLWSYSVCTREPGHPGSHVDDTGLTAWGTHEPPIPAQRDDEPCTHTLGPLTCPFKGPHTAHAYQSGTWAPDRKDDTDEGIE